MMSLYRTTGPLAPKFVAQLARMGSLLQGELVRQQGRAIFGHAGARSTANPTCESGCHIATLLSAPSSFALITPLSVPSTFPAQCQTGPFAARIEWRYTATGKIQSRHPELERNYIRRP